MGRLFVEDARLTRGVYIHVETDSSAPVMSGAMTKACACKKCGSHFVAACADQTLCSECIKWAITYIRVNRAYRYWILEGRV